MREMTIGRFVRRVLLLLAGVLALVTFAWLLPAGEAQEKDKGGKADAKGKDPAKLQWQKIVDESKTERISGRRNGVLLRAEVDLKKHAKGGVVLVHWFIDYDGPRLPFTIFKPSLDKLSANQISIHFFPVYGDVDYFHVGIDPDTSGSDPTLLGFALAFPALSQFITLQKNEIAKGTIEVPLATVEVKMRERYKEKTGKFPPSHLFARIAFTPLHRGDHLKLDSWTGDLRTAWIAVPLEKMIKE